MYNRMISAHTQRRNVSDDVNSTCGRRIYQTRKQSTLYNRRRRTSRLQNGGCPNRRFRHFNCDTHNRKKKKLAGVLSVHEQHNPYGLQWDRQSCWMDASMMALFYPEQMYNIIYPAFASNANTRVKDVRDTLCQIVSEMRSPQGAPHLHGLRSLLTNYANTRDQKYAFQTENQMGYVFYFLQELLRLFNVDCTRARSPYRKNYSKLYVMEMELCNNTSVEQCLSSTYKNWTFDANIAKYMIIELIDEDGKYSVRPQESVQFVGYEWTLCSMIVFDCSHFVSYVKEDGKWFLYDDTRSLSHQPLDPCNFGNYYKKGSCQFQYGKQNTFFFYTRL